MAYIELCDDTVRGLVIRELREQLETTRALFQGLQDRLTAGETLPAFEVEDYADLMAAEKSLVGVLAIYDARGVY